MKIPDQHTVQRLMGNSNTTAAPQPATSDSPPVSTSSLPVNENTGHLDGDTDEFRVFYGLLMTVVQFREWLERPAPYLGLDGVPNAVFDVVDTAEGYSVSSTQEEMNKIKSLHHHPLNLVVRFTAEHQVFLGFDLVMDRYCSCNRTEDEQLSFMNSFRCDDLLGCPQQSLSVVEMIDDHVENLV